MKALEDAVALRRRSTRLLAPRTAAAAGAMLAAALAVDACGGSGSAGKTSSIRHGGATAVERDGRVTIAADKNGDLAYNVRRATATAGSITFTMANLSGVEHNVAIQRGTNGAVLGATAKTPSGTSSVTLRLKPGVYTFFCQVDDHRGAGMWGTLTVR